MTKARTNADNVTADISGITAGTGISGGGTSGTVTITNSMATAIDSAGDLIYGTGADAFTRLAIGSTSNVLTVAGGVPTWAAPAASWSPNLTLLSTTSPSSADSVTINVSSYDYYVILWRGLSSNGGAMYSMKPNSSNTAGHYLAQLQILAKAVGQTIPAYTDIGTDRTTGNAGFLYFAKKGNQQSTTNYVDGIITLIGGKTTGAKSIQWTTNPSASNNYNAFGSSGNGVFDNGAAITSFQFFSSDGNFNGGTIEIYGG